MEELLKSIADKVPWERMPCVIALIGYAALREWFAQRTSSRTAQSFKDQDAHYRELIAQAYRGEDRRER